MRRGNSWIKYVWSALVLYMVLSVGRLAYKNYELNLQEAQLKTDITSLENEIQDLRNKIAYFQSSDYKEKMIRAKLNMKKEGEEVVVITPPPVAEQVSDFSQNKPKTNPERWLIYFFGNS